MLGLEPFQVFEHIDLMPVQYDFVALEGRIFDVLEGPYAFRRLCGHRHSLRIEVGVVRRGRYGITEKCLSFMSHALAVTAAHDFNLLVALWSQ